MKNILFRSVCVYIFGIFCYMTYANDTSMTTRLDNRMQCYHKRGAFSGSVLVAKDGIVLLSKGYGMADYARKIANTPQTKFRIGSITKQFTALAIMQLRQQGLLDIHDPLSKYIPDYPSGDQITIHHLLTHTSGIPNYTSLAHCEKNKAQWRSIDRLINTFKKRRLEFKPGAQYKYSNSGYVLLTYIIEQVSGQPYATYVQQHIFEPAGMLNTGYDTGGPRTADKACGYKVEHRHLAYADRVDMSYYAGAGALFSTVEDLYLWDRALHSNKLVSYDILDTIFTPWIRTPDCNQKNGYGYGYGWRIGDPNQKHPVVGHGGGIEGFSTTIRRFPNDDLCIILLSNVRTFQIVQKISQDLAAIVLGEKKKICKKTCKQCAMKRKKCKHRKLRTRCNKL